MYSRQELVDKLYDMYEEYGEVKQKYLGEYASVHTFLKRFDSIQNMRDIVQDEENKVCKECGAEFLTQEKRILHEPQCSGEEGTYKCAYCGYSSNFQQGVDDHEIRIHTDEFDKVYNCNYCDFKSRSQYGVNVHKNKVHKEQVGLSGPEKKQSPKYLECLECNEYFQTLPPHLVSKHSMNVDEYRKKYGERESVISEHISDFYSDNFSGDDNPFKKKWDESQEFREDFIDKINDVDKYNQYDSCIWWTPKCNSGGYLRSSWEIEFATYLEENDKVNSYEVEGIKISYEDVNGKKVYIPDFVLDLQEAVKCIVEIKPKYKFSDAKFKFSALKDYAMGHNIQYIILSDKVFGDEKECCIPDIIEQINGNQFQPNIGELNIVGGNYDKRI
jgi:hypothetical protein